MSKTTSSVVSVDKTIQNKKSPFSRIPHDDNELQQQQQQQQQQQNRVLLLGLVVSLTVAGIWYHSHVTNCRINDLQLRLTTIEQQQLQQQQQQQQTSTPIHVARQPSTVGHVLNMTSLNNSSSISENASHVAVELDDDDVSESSGVKWMSMDGLLEDMETSGLDIDMEVLKERKDDVILTDSDWIFSRKRRSVTDDDVIDDVLDDSEDEMMSDDPSVGRQRATPTPAAAAAAAAGGGGGGEVRGGGAGGPRSDNKHKQRTRSKQKSRNTANEQEDQLKLRAAHFQATTDNSQYTTGPVAPDTLAFWKVDNWAVNQSFYHLNSHNGIVTIMESGTYFIYAQLVYHDLTGRWSFGVFVGDKERIKCLNTEHVHHSEHQLHQSTDPNTASHGVYQNCYTAAALRLNKHDHVSVRCLYGSRTILTQPEFTFWGIIKLS